MTWSRGALLLALVVALSACRVDVSVGVDVAQNGSGTITVTAVADAAVVAAAPNLAADLQLDDVRAAGWQSDGPVPTADGGLSIVLTHGFDSPEQATALLADLNGPDGPLRAVSITREASRSGVDIVMTGAAGLTKGVSSFADPDALAALGAAPYADRLAAAGVASNDAVSVTFRATLPGEVRSTTGTVTAPERTVTWVVPTDGTRIDVAASSHESLERGGIWRVLPTIAFAVLVAWLVLMVVLIGLVIVRRRSRARATRITPSA
ncbi:MAG: hypothetical protein ACOYL9_12510 [Ilumatobacteraceae bacterium]